MQSIRTKNQWINVLILKEWSIEMRAKIRVTEYNSAKNKVKSRLNCI